MIEAKCFQIKTDGRYPKVKGQVLDTKDKVLYVMGDNIQAVISMMDNPEVIRSIEEQGLGYHTGAVGWPKR